MVYIYTMEYYSALKRKEILVHATTWMDLEDIMLSEISQLQKDQICKKGFHIDEIPKVVKFIETESKWWLSRAGPRENGELVFNRYRALAGED